LASVAAIMRATSRARGTRPERARGIWSFVAVSTAPEGADRTAVDGAEVIPHSWAVGAGVKPTLPKAAARSESSAEKRGRALRLQRAQRRHADDDRCDTEQLRGRESLDQPHPGQHGGERPGQGREDGADDDIVAGAERIQVKPTTSASPAAITASNPAVAAASGWPAARR
jgi:hypothetical protein